MPITFINQEWNLFLWIMRNLDAPALERFLMCLKKYQKHIGFKGGVKLDRSFRRSSVALEQIFELLHQRKALFDLLMSSLFEIYRKDFDRFAEDFQSINTPSELTPDKVAAFRKWKDRHREQAACWIAYVWSQGLLKTNDARDFVKWFSLVTSDIPNIFSCNEILSDTEVESIMDGTLMPSELAELEARVLDAEPFRAPQKLPFTSSDVGLTAYIDGSKGTVSIRAEDRKEEKAAPQTPKKEVRSHAASSDSTSSRKTLSVKKDFAERQSDAAAGLTVFDAASAMKHLPDPQPGLTRYFGYLRRQGSFLNFYVTGEYTSGGTLVDMSSEAAAKLFPAFGALLLRTTTRPNITDGSLMAIDLSPSDIVENLDWVTRTPRTDYARCADFDALSRMNRIHPAAEALTFPVVYPDRNRLPDIDLEKNIPVQMSAFGDEGVAEPRLTTLPVVLSYEGRFYGPTMLREDLRRNLYVTLQPAANSGLVHGWSTAGTRTVHLSMFSGIEENRVIRKSVDAVCLAGIRELLIDAYSEATLIKKLSALMTPDKAEQARIAAWLEANAENTRLFTDDERVSASRMARMKRAIEKRGDASKILANAKAKDEPSEETLERLAERFAADPVLMRKLEGLSVVKDRLAELRSQCEELEAEKKRLEKANREEESRFKAQAEAKNQTLLKENRALEAALEKRKSELGAIEACADDLLTKQTLEKEIAALRVERSTLEKEITGVGDMLRREVEDARKYAFDGALAARFRDAASLWQEKEREASEKKRFEAVRSLAPSGLQGRELADYLVDRVTAVRAFPREDVLNLFIALTQSFITVFAGPPGCGKTSVSTLVGETLGLGRVAELTNDSADNRFLTVPVGRGWTSNRDFIGFRNPLSDRFESTDPRRLAALRMLDAEAREGVFSLPFVMLLDEANLSPMEHWWGDFMGLADGGSAMNAVSIGPARSCRIPETLRFLATMNTDHTVEQLSPRLIDRAMVVTLPDFAVPGLMPETASEVKTPELIGWQALKALFGARPIKAKRSDIEDLLVGIYDLFRACGTAVSPRTRLAVEGYVSAAAEVFPNNTRPAHIAAVDFAVAQKLLPKISGTGEAYREGLEAVRTGLEASGLERSVALLDGVLKKGDPVGFWQFF